MTKEIELTQGFYTLIDNDDYERVSKYNWYYSNKYAVRNKQFESHRALEYLHRFIMNTPDGMDTDHINMNKLDNRKSNLRICSRSQNKFNINKPSSNTSGYKGVYWDSSRDKWVASICKEGKIIHLGRFINIDDAVRSYNEAAKHYHGEFAKLNNLKG